MKHIKTVFNHIRRTPYQAVTAVMIVSITFFVATLFLFLGVLSSSMLSYFERQPQITVYFEDTTTQADIDIFVKGLKKVETISSIKYVTKEEALKIYQDDHKDDPLLLEMVTADILPASLEIQAVDVSNLESIAKRIQGEVGVQDVIYHKDIVDKLVSWTRSIRALGGLLLTVLIVETLLVILTIIGVRIVNKRGEISILQLIGASRWYVRLPFVIEGAFYGFVGSVVGFIASIGLIFQQSHFFSGLLIGISSLYSNLFPAIQVWPISGAFVLVIFGVASIFGVLLGTLGSLIAVARYLE